MNIYDRANREKNQSSYDVFTLNEIAILSIDVDFQHAMCYK